MGVTNSCFPQKFDDENLWGYERNIMIEFLPNTIVNVIASYLKQSPLPASKREPNDHHNNDDKFSSFPLNIWVERESSQKDQPSLVIIIGASGSGKTTWATARFRNVYDTNDWFTEKKVDSDSCNLDKARNLCQAKVLQHLRYGDTVCVSNWNSTIRAMYNYVAAVIFGQLPHKIVFVRMPFFDCKILARRNIKGVSEETISKTIKKIKSMGRPTALKVMKAGPPCGKDRPNTSKTVVYLAIFLHEDSVEKLRDFVSNHSHQDLLEVVKGRHLTIQFLPTDEEVDAVALGEEVELKVKDIFINKWCQCVTVSGYEKYKISMGNKHPHITVAVQNGIFPSTSNYVIEYSNKRNVISDSELTVRGTIGAFISRDACVYLEQLLDAGTSILGLSEESRLSKVVWSHDAVNELRRQMRTAFSTKKDTYVSAITYATLQTAIDGNGATGKKNTR